jgi:predicted TPR repeat methyltransferase
MAVHHFAHGAARKNLMQPAQRSSGNLIADRRYEHARAYAESGDLDAAAELLEQAIELAPQWAFAWLSLAEIYEARAEMAAAVAAYRRAAQLDPSDALAVGLHLARLGVSETPQTAPEAYVSSFFDHYAETFEDHLVTALSYRGPAQLEAAVARQDRQNFAHVIDLGCGTGLCGAALRAKADVLTGVDLSPLMVARARSKEIYDELHVASIAQFLQEATDASADLLLAADVFIYAGDLDPVLSEAARVLRPNGLFAFTLQKQISVNGAGFCIGADLRYAHDPDYVTAIAARHNYELLQMTEESPRRERGHDVPGLVVLLRRR